MRDVAHADFAGSTRPAFGHRQARAFITHVDHAYTGLRRHRRGPRHIAVAHQAEYGGYTLFNECVGYGLVDFHGYTSKASLTPTPLPKGEGLFTLLPPG